MCDAHYIYYSRLYVHHENYPICVLNSSRMRNEKSRISNSVYGYPVYLQFMCFSTFWFGIQVKIHRIRIRPSRKRPIQTRLYGKSGAGLIKIQLGSIDVDEKMCTI